MEIIETFIRLPIPGRIEGLGPSCPSLDDCGALPAFHISGRQRAAETPERGGEENHADGGYRGEFRPYDTEAAPR
jgi:hypothetical protein